MSVFEDLGVPGPPPNLFTGNLSELIRKGPAKAFCEWSKKYGDVYGVYNGGTPMMIVKDLELIKKIQIKDFGNFHRRGEISTFSRTHKMKRLSLVNAYGGHWKEMRSLLTPAFTTSNMKKVNTLPVLMGESSPGTNSQWFGTHKPYSVSFTYYLLRCLS